MGKIPDGCFMNVNQSGQEGSDDPTSVILLGGADQPIFGVEAAPKWSHASFMAQSSQFDILINRFGQLHTASVDSWFWTKRKSVDAPKGFILCLLALPLISRLHVKEMVHGAQNDISIRAQVLCGKEFLKLICANLCIYAMSTSEIVPRVIVNMHWKWVSDTWPSCETDLTLCL